MRRFAICLAFAASLTLVLAAGSPARRVSQAPPVKFTDAGGDSGTAADITTVAVTNDDKGQYRLDLGFATPYGDTAFMLIFLDTDLNPQTGDANALGADYLLADDHDSHSFSLLKWSGTDWVDAPATTAAVAIAPDNKTLSASVNKSELGNSTGFNFVIITADGDGSAGHFDDAPSGNGSLQYKLQETFDLAIGSAVGSPVKAGGTWNVGIAVIRSDTGKTLGPEATIACKGTSGATKLAVTARAFVSGGSGGASAALCSFKVPKKLRHKPLRGTITVSYKGKSVSKTFTTIAK